MIELSMNRTKMSKCMPKLKYLHIILFWIDALKMNAFV